jgi:hypothetical protein
MLRRLFASYGTWKSVLGQMALLSWIAVVIGLHVLMEEPALRSHYWLARFQYRLYQELTAKTTYQEKAEAAERP